MKLFRYMKTSLFLLLAFITSNAQALIVSFEEQEFRNASTQLFQDANLGGGTQQLVGLNFSENAAIGGSIMFSGGVTLINPTETDPILFDGDVLYGTAFSPSTGAETSPLGPPAELPSVITIEIDPIDQVNLVEGLLINGLNTDREDGMGNLLTTELANYAVSVFTTDLASNFAITTGDLPSNLAGGFDLFSVTTEGLMNSIGEDVFITQIQIRANPSGPVDALGNTGIDFGQGFPEWDFLIDAVSFNEELPPIPIPAALPLFLSALFGGWLFARPRKPSERIS